MKRLVAVAQLALCLVFVFCNSGDGQTRPAELVGQWEHASGDGETWEMKPTKLELFKDGTGVVDGGTSVSWKVENKRFVILSPFFVLSCNYKVSGYELALGYDDGTSAIFVRKGKLEEFEAKQAAAAEAKRVAEAKRALEQLPKFTDSRDGKVYRKVTIGGKTWMAENLNFAAKGSKCYGEGGVVVVDVDEEGNPINPTKLSNAEVQANCAKYGRLYDWETANKACPSGFHLATDDEWTALENAVVGRSMMRGGERYTDAGTKLKSTAGWNEDGNGTNDFGWSALPGGYGSSGGSFGSAGNYGDWWSATEDGATHARGRNMGYNYEDVLRINYDKTDLFSVRCAQD